VRELETVVAQLEGALSSRQELGLVTGVLAVRLGVTPDVAWSFLVRLSQHSNIKSREIARILRAGYFGQIAEEDRALAARLNEHLPASVRMKLAGPGVD
jgi:ANTAR domain